MKRTYWWATLPLAIVGVVLAPSARADASCNTAADCRAGYLCNISPETPCLAIACLSGQDCPATNCGSETRACMPGATCTSDADCSPELKCVTGARSSCEPRNGSLCADDAECGPGLHCVASEQCSCAATDPGSAPSIQGGASAGTPTDVAVPTPSPDAREVPVVVPDPGGEPATCTCTTGPKVCQLIRTECGQDGDCPQGWTCARPRSSACSASRDGQTTCTEGPERPGVCVAPYPTYGSGTLGSTANEAGHDNGVDPIAPTTGQPPQSTGSTKSESTGQGSPEVEDRAGGFSCQFGGTNTGLGASSWMAALGLAALVTRRRRAAR